MRVPTIAYVHQPGCAPVTVAQTWATTHTAMVWPERRLAVDTYYLDHGQPRPTRMIDVPSDDEQDWDTTLAAHGWRRLTPWSPGHAHTAVVQRISDPRRAAARYVISLRDDTHERWVVTESGEYPDGIPVPASESLPGGWPAGRARVQLLAENGDEIAALVYDLI